ncbi:uncharacterized protein LOC126687279 [Mercurialis annua]|uniref:uncharacterized protein LOC126687279 n=1 Tax=Mercurialis annua TaxID=3986 RepID=UPI00215F56A3|nr:uncharacterized protein LOC126687279 [Mercurialis annua]
MALNNPRLKTLETAAVDNTASATASTSRSPNEQPESIPEEEDVEDKELENLELEAEEMVKKIIEYRASLPDQLKTTFSSILSAQRPVLAHIDSGSDPGPAGESYDSDLRGQNKSSNSALPTEGEEKIADKVRLLKDKISSNISAMPIVLKRMRESVSKIDNLDSDNGIIHPAFKRKSS